MGRTEITETNMKYQYLEHQLPTPDNSKLLALVGQNKKVLEVGCALGYQSRSLKEIQHCEVTGIEIDAGAATHSGQYCEHIIVGDIETLDLGQQLHDSQFDVITFADVLEHLRNPTYTLQKVKPFLREGGYVLASIPNVAHASVIYEMARGRFEYRSLGLLDNTHIHFFTRQSIYQTFDKAGYLIVAIDRIRVPASDTEFKTIPETTEDRQFLEYIRQHNPENETYQFVIKAIPVDDKKTQQSEIIVAQEQILLLQLDASLNKKRIRELEWTINRPIFKFLSSFVKFFKR